MKHEIWLVTWWAEGQRSVPYSYSFETKKDALNLVWLRFRQAADLKSWLLKVLEADPCKGWYMTEHRSHRICVYKQQVKLAR